MMNGLQLQPKSSRMSLHEDMWTSPLMRSTLFARKMCISSFHYLPFSWYSSFPRLLHVPNGTSLTISHRSLLPLLPISKMSLNDTSSAPSRTSGTRYHGGLTTEPSIRVSLGWHSTTYPYQVYPSIVTSPLLNLIIPTATSVDVERVFSKGRLVLSHIRNKLSVQSTRTLMCLGAWSRMGLVKDKDVMAVVRLPAVDRDETELDSGWDDIL